MIFFSVVGALTNIHTSSHARGTQTGNILWITQRVASGNRTRNTLHDGQLPNLRH